MLQGNKLLSFKSDKSHEIYGQTKGLLQVSEDYGEITSKCNLGSWTLVEITTRHLEKLACLIYDNISVNNITNHLKLLSNNSNNKQHVLLVEDTIS